MGTTRSRPSAARESSPRRPTIRRPYRWSRLIPAPSAERRAPRPRSHVHVLDEAEPICVERPWPGRHPRLSVAMRRSPLVARWWSRPLAATRSGGLRIASVTDTDWTRTLAIQAIARSRDPATPPFDGSWLANPACPGGRPDAGMARRTRGPSTDRRDRRRRIATPSASQSHAEDHADDHLPQDSDVVVCRAAPAIDPVRALRRNSGRRQARLRATRTATHAR